jgi:nitrite reductase/ring-hydroxylating ferredoxin subunit
MLSTVDNDLLCRVGPGTLMGEFMRQYWIPAVRSDELPAPDCPPVRIRLLGENLIAYRTTSGAVGLMQNSCPHRGASMFFGRNEEEGLRCVYHGWKFDVTGACVEMPSEPAESNFKSKVRATAYRTHERGGIIWAYMGQREVPPPLPDIEANLLSEGAHQISVLHRECNWMQGLEGEMDTVHAAFLHGGASRVETSRPGTGGYYTAKQRSAKFSVIETNFGTSYGAYRPAEEDSYYWRIAHVLFPFYAMPPLGPLGENALIGMYVPMDDENHLHWEIMIRPGVGSTLQGLDQASRPAASAGNGPTTGRGVTLPNTTDWYGRFNIEQNARNDYMIDREAQRNWESFSGIQGVRQQDMAVTESMGPIYQRDHEHLGTTDQLIIRTRRKLLACAKDWRDKGIIPPGVDNPEFYRQRSGDLVLPRSVDWWEGTKDRRERFDAVVDRPPVQV